MNWFIEVSAMRTWSSSSEREEAGCVASVGPSYYGESKVRVRRDTCLVFSLSSVRTAGLANWYHKVTKYFFHFFIQIQQKSRESIIVLSEYLFIATQSHTYHICHSLNFYGYSSALVCPASPAARVEHRHQVAVVSQPGISRPAIWTDTEYVEF